ncbi:5'/3'-nucleotidase SurE [Neoehrlichia mikurensis]|uniref:5'-nucleotidase SurE n=1 Tax=Neoehrlichia mikurensis TaxID=89586 RepID=A0A9Q9BZY4_9RICK|nr:5'/3'-nucleotidase SurE [Neoehrlichia mikurensis]QXK92072.1 5'/3'-nucleotidase SurE [Neoehrlichia mikurensis]QXK92529.1 5'/3'-nucleotidase SurE [Neoehrlichia mikurensis]QXK93765.1 5'/3'-nucleotidase SurE [Neoehrlichia mikurensis]UTO55259.1 5'/3'-nucleotidase SurE [Neoehrlichia mikurensis]UTO56180.1 5'/3'-nucleotidase SurE [Neoehrlichia mikurensis]
MKILLTNDDGFHAEGIKVLQEIVSNIASKIWVVAPAENYSRASRSINQNVQINVQKVRENEFIVHGTPAESVFIGLRKIINEKPDLILSGINHGSNVGNDIIYSGTIGAAIEGAVMHIPSIAISQAYQDQTIKWENSRKFLLDIIHKLMNNTNWKKSTTISINIPCGDVKGIQFVEQGAYFSCNNIDVIQTDNYSQSYVIREISPKNQYYKLNNRNIAALYNGYIAITPINTDMTDYNMLNSLIQFNDNQQCI